MLQSTAKLLSRVKGPIENLYGPSSRVLTVELHDDEVRGLVLCPGRILHYVVNEHSSIIRTSVILKIALKPSGNLSL